MHKRDKVSDDCVEDRQVRAQSTPEPLQRLVCSFPVQSIALARSWPGLCPLFHYSSTINMKSPLRTLITLLPLHSQHSVVLVSSIHSRNRFRNWYAQMAIPCLRIARGHVRPP